MKNTLCELLDQATILGHRKTNKEIAEYLESCGVIVCRQDELPAADVQPVKRGKWILIDNDTVHGKCSECGFECHYYEDDVFGMPFCPNCNAQMMEEE